jgi:hypothetical protein
MKCISNYALQSAVNVKVKLSLCLTKHHAMKAYWGMHPLNSARDGDEWSASRPGRFTLREAVPVTHWRGDWVGSRAGVVSYGIPDL